MLATLALSAVLNAAPAELTISNARVTYGIHGQDRPKTQTFNPGDLYVITFDIENLTAKADGTVKYSMGVELIQKGAKGKKDKSVFKQEPRELTTVNPLGGTRMPSFAMVNIGLDSDPGQYTFKVTVTDLQGKAKAKPTATLERTFRISKPTFGFVRLFLNYDSGNPAPPLAVPGQTLSVQFALVGFQLKGAKQQPNVSIEVRIYDDKDKPTISKPITGEVKKVVKGFEKIIPFDPISIPINRTGKFKVVVKATDNSSKTTVTETLYFHVIDPRKLK
jgi:hypothetical protein